LTYQAPRDLVERDRPGTPLIQATLSVLFALSVSIHGHVQVLAFRALSSNLRVQIGLCPLGQINSLLGKVEPELCSSPRIIPHFA
ncbi:hypothetical protein ABTL34_19200, partial [Acinetobacter baumannii]